MPVFFLLLIFFIIVLLLSLFFYFNLQQGRFGAEIVFYILTKSSYRPPTFYKFSSKAYNDMTSLLHL